MKLAKSIIITHFDMMKLRMYRNRRGIATELLRSCGECKRFFIQNSHEAKRFPFIIEPFHSHSVQHSQPMAIGTASVTFMVHAYERETPRYRMHV